MPKYLEFRKSGDITNVISKKTQQYLGEITYYKPWKCLIFEPRENAVFDIKCLRHIIAYIAIEAEK